MLQIALVGKPNAGKSSFLRALTLASVKVSPVPFTTIKPNIAIGHVTLPCVCKEFGIKCTPKTGFCTRGVRGIPVKLIDVGGLIPGSHAGRGIGNAFLDEARQAVGLVQVVDASGLTDAEGKATTGYDPAEEIEFLQAEFDLWFASVIEKALRKIERVAKFKRVDVAQLLAEQLSGLGVSKAQVEVALQKSSLQELKQFASELRKISKPIQLVANKVDLPQAQQNYEKLKQKYPNILPASAEAELALKLAEQQGLIEYTPCNGFRILDESRIEKPKLEALQRIQQLIERYGSTGVQAALNKLVLEVLNYVPVWPVADASKLCDSEGNVLPDVLLMPPGSSIKELAASIHSELAERFICGIDARSKQRLNAEYQLKARDVVEIKFRR